MGDGDAGMVKRGSGGRLCGVGVRVWVWVMRGRGGGMGREWVRRGRGGRRIVGGWVLMGRGWGVVDIFWGGLWVFVLVVV